MLGLCQKATVFSTEFVEIFLAAFKNEHKLGTSNILFQTVQISTFAFSFVFSPTLEMIAA